jgi:outer membrane protein TolC
VLDDFRLLNRVRPAESGAFDSRRPPGPSAPRCAGRGVCFLGLALAVVATSACASYSPSPLDLEAHREAWHGRTLENGIFEDHRGWLEGEAPTVFDVDDGLALEEGRLVALAYQPGLRLARLRLGKAAASSEYAGAWVDPGLSLSAQRITDSVPDPWVLDAGLVFTIPLGDRLEAQQGVADARTRSARSALRDEEWTVWCDVRRGWIDWSSAQLRAEETASILLTVDSLVGSAERLAEAGELARTEASLFAIERAQLRSRLTRLRADAQGEHEELRALLGLAPGAPVELTPSLALAPDPDQVAGLDELIALRNPRLAQLREEYQVAEESLRLEIAEQVPDLSLGPLYESDAGQPRIGLGGGIPIPVFHANLRAINEAAVSRELARASFEVEYESLVSRARVARLRSVAIGEQRQHMRGSLVPLVTRQLEDALQLMELGEGSSLVLLESLTRAYQARLELIETRATEALARAEVERLVGPPRSDLPEEATSPFPAQNL